MASNEKKTVNFLGDDFMYTALNLFLQEAGLLTAPDDVKGDFVEKVAIDLVDFTNKAILSELKPEQIETALKISEQGSDYSSKEKAYSELIPNFSEKIQTVMDLVLRKVRLGLYNN